MQTLMRWSPLFATRRNGIDSLIDDFVAGPRRLSGQFAPAADIHENAEGFVIRMDLPGVAQQDVKVTLEGDTLTVRGERKSETQSQQDSAYYRERVFGSFERTFTLTSPVRADQVKATYRDGVLEVSVPKAEEAKVREIQIQVG